jgi:hypothetical protein
LSFLGSGGPSFRLAHAKGSKNGIDNLAGKAWCGPSLKSSARDLEPDTDDDISAQFYILHVQAPLGFGFS